MRACPFTIRKTKWSSHCLILQRTKTQRRRECKRPRHASETPSQREDWLQRKVAYKKRKDRETPDERSA